MHTKKFEVVLDFIQGVLNGESFGVLQNVLSSRLYSYALVFIRGFFCIVPAKVWHFVFKDYHEADFKHWKLFEFPGIPTPSRLRDIPLLYSPAL